jgi:hypothetical protein
MPTSAWVTAVANSACDTPRGWKRARAAPRNPHRKDAEVHRVRRVVLVPDHAHGEVDPDEQERGRECDADGNLVGGVAHPARCELEQEARAGQEDEGDDEVTALPDDVIRELHRHERHHEQTGDREQDSENDFGTHGSSPPSSMNFVEIRPPRGF